MAMFSQICQPWNMIMSSLALLCLLMHDTRGFSVQQQTYHDQTRHRTRRCQLQSTVYPTGGDPLPPGKPMSYLSNKACTSQLGGFNIVAEEIDLNEEQVKQESCQHNLSTIRLLNVGSGWGNGAHPTTKLCFDFLSKTVNSGQTVLDYGTGSGILAILAAKLGAKSVVAVDIDEDTIVAATKNALLNGVAEKIDITHTRYVYVGEDRFPLADITVANILPGALSMLAGTLWSFTKPGGRLCISGLRPHELPAIQRIYAPFVDRDSDEEVHQESHVIYGDWVSWSVRTKAALTPAEKLAIRNMLTDAAMDR